MSISDDAKLEADIRGQTYPRGGDVGAFMRLLDQERATSKELRAALRDVLPFIVDEKNQSPGNAAVAAWWRKHEAVLATIPRPGEQDEG